MKTTIHSTFRITLLLLIFSISSNKSLAQKLTLLWETPAVLPGVESVIYDTEADLIYSANINGHFMARDGNGSISQIDMDGQVVNAEWINGLDAPTGLGIYKRKLYVTDIDQIVEIDITEGKISNRWSVPGAKAFNDIAVGADGTVYASDTGGDAVYALKDDTVIKVLDNIKGPNGLLSTPDRFLTVLWYAQALYSVDLKTQKLTELATGIVNPDGIEEVGDGSLLVTGLNGLIYFVDKSGKKLLLADTSSDKVQAADIDYVASKRLLLVPTLSSNKVMAYRLEL